MIKNTVFHGYVLIYICKCAQNTEFVESAHTHRIVHSFPELAQNHKILHLTSTSLRDKIYEQYGRRMSRKYM
jgi:hypothetical protein